jgi:acyl-CoA thioester hydrolase
MSSVYYGKYFEYFEQGRSDFLRALGLPYSKLEQQGFFLPVIEAHAVYKRAARYDDLLSITTTLSQMPAARIRLDYSVVREGEKDILAEGYTVHSFVHSSTGKPTRVPGPLLDVISAKLRNSKA